MTTAHIVYINFGLALGTLITSTAQSQVVTENQEIYASDGTQGDSLGWKIAIDDGILVASAMNHDVNGLNSGAVYTFNASTGAQLSKFYPLDGSSDDQFGFSVDIHSGMVAVGAWHDDDNGSNSGSAYLFDAKSGTQLFKLIPTDGSANDLFGRSIAIHNNFVVVGASGDNDNGTNSGSVYIFDATTGVQLHKLLAFDGFEHDTFGNAVAVHNSIIAVGARLDDDFGFGSGSAYLFDANTGVFISKLLPTNGAQGHNFGDSLAIFGDRLVVGASFAGAAYVFDIPTGTQLLSLSPDDYFSNDQFGFSVAIDNNLILIGSPSANINFNINQGAAYFFDATTGIQVEKLISSNGTGLEALGVSVAFENQRVACGAHNNDDLGENSGSIYMYSTPSTCLADLTNDGLLNFFDISAFLVAFTANETAADFNGDGLLNFFDISEFLQAFTAGCP